MTIRFARLLPALLLALLLAVSASAQTRQAKADDPLFKQLAAFDAAIFDAFNTCDLDKFGSYFAEDLEFFHDKGGVTRGRAALVESVKNNICGKVRRELVAGSMEVHPMDNYGAVQIGSHRFCEAKLSRCEPNSSGIAKFIHLWENKNGVWKITRVLSFDHVDSK
jgi:hypothetical protein